MELLSDMFEISCIETYKAYHRENRVDCEGEIEIISETKYEVINKIRDIIFEVCEGEFKAITYEDLYKLFKDYYNEGVINIYL